MRTRALLCIGMTGASIALLGCQESSGGSSPAPVASSAAPLSAPQPSASASAAEKPRQHFARHGGIAASLFRMAHDLPDLSQAQDESLGKIEATLKADDDGIRTAMKSFRGDLVAGVRAGKLDTAKLTGDDGIVDKAIADHQSKEADALDSLHTLLTPVQRPALVANIRAKQADHEAHMTEWMQGKGGDGGTVDWTKKRLDKLTADLTLDAGQQKQVAAILAKPTDVPNAAAMQARWADRKTKMDALLTAFAADSFDAKKVDLGMMPGKTAHEPMDHMVAYYTQLLPILHPDQRDKLATSMDKPFGADRRGAGGAAGGGAAAAGGGAGDDISFPFSEPEEVP
jgi:Spy/CpxP family protein refolding chaperone